jgi:hypothetical protein
MRELSWAGGTILVRLAGSNTTREWSWAEDTTVVRPAGSNTTREWSWAEDTTVVRPAPCTVAGVHPRRPPLRRRLRAT